MRQGGLIITAGRVRWMIILTNTIIERRGVQNTVLKPPTLGNRGQIKTAIMQRARRTSPGSPADICPGFVDIGLISVSQ